MALKNAIEIFIHVVQPVYQNRKFKIKRESALNITKKLFKFHRQNL